MSLAKTMAELFVERYGTNMTKEEVETHFYEAWNRNERNSFIFDELIKILESDYNFSFEKIKI